MSTYPKAVTNGVLFYSKLCWRVKKRNSYTAVYEDSTKKERYGQIENFVVQGGAKYAVMTELAPQQHSERTTKRLLVVKPEPHPVLIPLKNLLTKCVFIHIESTLYIRKFPNQLTQD